MNYRSRSGKGVEPIYNDFDNDYQTISVHLASILDLNFHMCAFAG